MKKSLLATVAAVALIASAGVVSAAEGAKDQPKAGHAQTQKAPEMKGAAEMKGKAETTGAGAGEKAEMKAEPKAEMKAEPKAEMKAPAKADMKADSKDKPATSGQAMDQKAAPAAKSASDNKAGASG